MANKLTIDYLTVATTANAGDFGDLRTQATDHQGSRQMGGYNGLLIGAYAGGYKGTGNSGSGITDEIEYVTMGTLGNTSAWGELTNGAYQSGAMSNTLRGVCMGRAYQTDNDRIDYITWANQGDAVDFGNATDDIMEISPHGAESTTRGVMLGGRLGYPTYNFIETMEYITFASTGNATIFGDHITYGEQQSYGSGRGPEGNYWASGMSNGTRGEFWGGVVPDDSYPHRVSTTGIQYITIASTGNSTDAGNLTEARHHMHTGQGT